MTCRNCKREIPKGSRRCKHCGKVVGSGQYFFSSCFDKIRIPITVILLIVLIFGIFWGIRALIGINKTPEVYDRDMGTYTPDDQNIVYEDESQSVGYVNNMVLIYFTSDTDDEKISEIIKHIDGEVVGIMPGVNQFQVQVDARTKEELEALRQRLLRYDEVKYVQIDYVIATAPESVIPNDPWIDPDGYTASWDEEKPGDTNWWVEAAHILSAWEYQDEFHNISVGVADGGFDTAHDDLNVIVLNEDENDPDSHGTAVAGMIGATGNNGLGITGILQDVNLYCGDFYTTAEQDAQNITISTMFDCLNGCVQNGCKVVNLSSGLNYDCVWENPAVSELTATFAIEYLLFMMDAYDHDFIIVQSSGNGDNWGFGVDAYEYNGYFCSVDLEMVEDYLEELAADGVKLEKEITAEDIMNSIMVVASVDCERNGSSYQLAQSSNFGDSVTVAAPGVHILTTAPNDSYRYANGTSFAAPLTSGVTAMVWAVDPDMTSGQVKDIIVSTATQPVLPRTWSDTGTYYLIDAAAAVEKAIELRDSHEQIEPPALAASDFGVYPEEVRFIVGSNPDEALYKYIEGGNVNHRHTGSDSPAIIIRDNPHKWFSYRFDKSLDKNITAYLELLQEEPFNLELIHQETIDGEDYYFYRYNGTQDVYSLPHPLSISMDLGEFHFRVKVDSTNSRYIAVDILAGFGLEAIDAEEYKSILSGGNYQRGPDPIVDIQ